MLLINALYNHKLCPLELVSQVSNVAHEPLDRNTSIFYSSYDHKEIPGFISNHTVMSYSSLDQNFLASFKQTWHKASLGDGDLRCFFFQMKGHTHLPVK